jgi:hypothetical protein
MIYEFRTYDLKTGGVSHGKVRSKPVLTIA